MSRAWQQLVANGALAIGSGVGAMVDTGPERVVFVVLIFFLGAAFSMALLDVVEGNES